jgi:hypothetical protein
MKNLISTAVTKMQTANEVKLLNPFKVNRNSFFYLVMLLCTLLFAGCKKENTNDAQNEVQPDNSSEMKSDMEFTAKCGGGIKSHTLRELQQARAATARYRNFDNAVRDQYTDINVVMPNMGYHFMKSAFVDGVFEITKPELLVYNKDAYGNFHLVALEYAVPIAKSPDAAPQGFTGNTDVWDRNEEFGLWTLHAWVWKFNPAGIFNPTNPLVTVR